MIFSFASQKRHNFVHNFADDKTLSSFAKSVLLLVEILTAEYQNAVKWFSENNDC